MSRTLAQGESADGIEAVPADEIEELGDEAIIAQQSQAHLPQKRANVQEELRSVVIAEEPVPTSSRRPAPYRGDAPDAATLVLRDRRELEAARRRVIEQKHRRERGRGLAPFVWAALAIGAFAAGGLVTLLIVRGSASAVAPVAVEAKPASEQRARASAAVRINTARPEPATPQVKLEELPLEKPSR